MSESVAKNTMYLTLATVSQRFIAFVYFLFLARIMKPEATGEYFLALSIVMIFMVIANFGFPQVIIREIAKNTQNAEVWLRHALGFMIPAVILAAVAANLAPVFLGYDPLLRKLIMLASLLLFADSFSVLFYGVLRGFQKIKYEAAGVLISQIITILVGGTVLLVYPSLIWLIAALIGGSFFNLAFSAFHAVRVMGRAAFRPAFSADFSWQLMKITVPFGLAGVFSKISSYLDTILLSVFISTTAVGIYAVAYKLTYAFQFLPLAFIAALYPGLSSLAKKEPDKLNRLFDQAMWYMMLLCAPIALGIWSLAPDIVRLAGSDYEQAIPVLRLLILVLFPIFLDFPIGSLLNATDRQSVKTAILGASTLINAILNFLLIPSLGIIGAAYAGLASFSFMFAAGLFFVPRVILGYRLGALLKTLLPILLSGLVMAAAVIYLRPILGFALSLPAGAIIYILSLILTRSLRPHHWQTFIRLLKKTPSYETSAPAHDA